LSSLPLVSIIIPCFNREWSLEETVRPLEIVFIDDGSTDATPEVIDRITIHANDQASIISTRQTNRGPASARNTGLRLCTGEFICFLDSDDLLLPGSIEKRASYLISNSNASFCYGLTSVRDAAGKKREDIYAGEEYEFFARLKYHARDVGFLPTELTAYVKHEHESMFKSHNLSYTRAAVKILLAIASLIAFGPNDTPQERTHLATQFRINAQRLLSLRATTDALSAGGMSFFLRPTLAALFVIGLSIIRYFPNRWYGPNRA
jgi:glycosyltransferase involved in cell wall biosynthesis